MRSMPVAHGLFAASGSQTAGFAHRLSERVGPRQYHGREFFRERGMLGPAITCMKGLTEFFEKQRRVSAKSSMTRPVC